MQQVNLYTLSIKAKPGMMLYDRITRKEYKVPKTGKVIFYVGATKNLSERLRIHKYYAFDYKQQILCGEKPRVVGIYKFIYDNGLDPSTIMIHAITKFGIKRRTNKTPEESNLIEELKSINLPIQNVLGAF